MRFAFCGDTWYNFGYKFMLHEIEANKLSITEDGASLLTYCYDDDDAFEGRPYLHPFYAPNGQVVTAGVADEGRYPPGVCFTLGHVNGEQLDWESLTASREVSTGEHSEAFTVVTRWADSESEPVLIETCTIDAHPRQTDVQMVDLAVTLSAVTTSLEFSGDVGLGYSPVDMEYRKAADANSRLGASEVNGNKSVWGTLSGVTTGEHNTVGIAILPHPTNGETVFLAEDVSAGFLFAQSVPFKVSVGLERTLKYRVIAYVGDLFTVDIWEYHHDYIG